jgi:hypothetical protein
MVLIGYCAYGTNLTSGIIVGGQATMITNNFILKLFYAANIQRWNLL